MRTSTRVLATICAVGALALSTGCGSDTPSTPGSIDLSLASTAGSVVAGSSTTVGITVSRVNFSNDISLAVSGAPAGVTTSLSATVLPDGTNSATLTINTDASAAAGASTITVSASGSGVDTKSAAYALTVTPAPAYAMTLASTSATVAQNASTTVNVALARTNFTGAVTLAASGVPSGASVTFSPNPATADASVMTVNAGTAAAGAYTITVTGSASGITDRTASFALTITVPPSFALTTPATLSIVSGATGTANVGIDRTNFTGDVTLTVAGLPAGATGSFSPNPASGATSVLTITTGTAAAGTYPLTITGAGTGLTNRTAATALTITSAATTSVGFAFCADRLPAWVAYQSGTGPWTQASADANNTYSFNIAGRGGVAIVRPTNGVSAAAGYSTQIFYASAAELQSIGTGNCATPTLGTKTVNGSVAGAGTDLASVVLGNAQASTFGNGPFTLDSVLNGPHDLLATLRSSTTFTATEMIIRRSLDPVTGSTLPVLDFSSSEAFSLTPSTLLLPGVSAATQVFVSSTFSTANGSATSTGFSQTTAGAATYTGVPVTIAGDLQEVMVQAQEATGVRGAITFFTGTGTRTLTMGPPLSVPTVTSLGITPYPRLRVQYVSQAEYGAIAMALFHQGGATSASTDRDVSIAATPAYFGGVPATWDLSIPDLSSAAGFNSIWMLAPATSTQVTAAGYGGNFLTAAPAVGTTFYFAQSASIVTTTTSPGVLRLAPSRRSMTSVAAQNSRMLQIMRDRRTMVSRR